MENRKSYVQRGQELVNSTGANSSVQYAGPGNFLAIAEEDKLTGHLLIDNDTNGVFDYYALTVFDADNNAEVSYIDNNFDEVFDVINYRYLDDEQNTLANAQDYDADGKIDDYAY